MRTDLKRDSHGDAVFPLQKVYGIEVIAQNVAQRLRTWKKDWRFNQNYGRDRRRYIVHHPKSGSIKTDLISQVLLVDGVKAVRSYREVWDKPSRHMTVWMELLSVEGTFEFTFGLGSAGNVVLVLPSSPGFV